MKPILFNTEMVQKILSGEKTVTRRVVKPQPKGAHTVMDSDDKAHTFDLLCGNGGKGGIFVDWAETVKAPFWRGDILYVRETWQYAFDLDGNERIIDGTGRYLYAADNLAPFNVWLMPDGTYRDTMPWRPSIHMPREAARIFLRVTDVWVEQLQDISERGTGGAVAEGCANDINLNAGTGASATKHFHNLWNSTIKKADLDRYGWDANPWVWVIEFERCEKPK